MPTRAKRPCAAAGCGNVVSNGRYCAAHVVQARTVDKRPSRSKRGYDRNWQRLRLLKLRSNPVCEECLLYGHVVQATEVDHIKPLREGGTNQDENLRSLCKSCHSRKTARETMVRARG